MKKQQTDIDPLKWRENLAELARLQGREDGVPLLPPAIGKTRMEEIASQLSDARKQQGCNH